jgi:hypothetical protein
MFVLKKIVVGVGEEVVLLLITCQDQKIGGSSVNLERGQTILVEIKERWM